MRNEEMGVNFQDSFLNILHILSFIGLSTCESELIIVEKPS